MENAILRFFEVDYDDTPPPSPTHRAGNASRPQFVSPATAGLSDLALHLLNFESTSQVPEGLSQHVTLSKKAQAKWYAKILTAWRESPPRTPEEAASLVARALQVQRDELAGILRFYSLPFPQIQTQVSSPSSWLEEVQFELHALPVGDGDGMTVNVNTENPREFGIVPIEVHEATIERRQTQAIRDYAGADALHSSIINCGYRIITANNEEIFPREDRIKLRGIDAPEMNMEFGQEVKDVSRTLIQIQTQVPGPSSRPEGVQFELHTLPVDAKLVGDGDGMTVHVNTEDPRESGIVPIEVHEATIGRRQARAIKDYALADALHNIIINCGYRVITSNNEEILAREYRIRLRGIDAPEINMEFGQEAKDALRKFIQGKPLTIHVHDKDPYDRLVGDVYCNGIFVQDFLRSYSLPFPQIQKKVSGPSSWPEGVQFELHTLPVDEKLVDDGDEMTVHVNTEDPRESGIVPIEVHEATIGRRQAHAIRDYALADALHNIIINCGYRIITANNEEIFPREDRIKLRGIDAPEMNMEFGQEVKDVSRTLIQVKPLTIHVYDKDPYDRLVGLPFTQIQTQVPGPSSRPEGVQFELHTLPVDAKLVGDGDGMTVHVNTEDPRESGIVPIEVHEATIGRRQARAIKDYALADALHNIIINCGYRVITSNNEEILAREYRIRLRGIDAPEINMEFGQEAKDALRKFIQGKPLTIHVHDKDPYDRLVGDVYCNGIFVQDFLRSYSLPFPQIQKKVSGPSSWPEGVQFELHTLPVDEKLVDDGDEMTVHVNTEDPRESGIVPIEVHEATIGRRQAHAIRDYALADALHNIIINCGYRVITFNNEEILAREYRIRLRGIDAPEINMEFGKEAKDALRKFIHGKPLTIHVYDKDPYDRLVGDVYCNGIFIQGFLRSCSLPFMPIQTQVPGPSSRPEGVQFELHTLPVDEKLVGDGDDLKVQVNTEDPRESGIVPIEVHEATIGRRQARAIRDYALADALHNIIINCGYRVITSNNEEILAREYRIRLRGIDAPEMNMELGQEAKDALRKLIQGKPLTIYVYNKDPYDRLVGDVYCNGIFVQDFLRSCSLPFTPIQTQVSSLSSRPEGVHFELHTLPVDAKLVGDGDGMTVHVNTEDPRESGIIPIEVHEATIGRRQARTIRDYALADALHNIIINCGYRVITSNNEEILAREYHIILRGIDAPEMNMELGQEAKDALRKLIQGKPLTIHVYDKDPFDRLVGDVYCNGIFVQDFLRSYSHPFPQIQTQVSGPSSRPEGVQFELHTLPVDEKLVGDGDGMTVHVNTEDPRESGIVPIEVHEATIGRRQAHAIRDYALADALHNIIINCGYRVISYNNEEILAREYRIRLRGIDAPEMNMELGQEAKDALRKLIQRKPLTIHVYDKDSYDTLVGDVYCNGIFVQGFLRFYTLQLPQIQTQVSGPSSWPKGVQFELHTLPVNEKLVGDGDGMTVHVNTEDPRESGIIPKEVYEATIVRRQARAIRDCARANALHNSIIKSRYRVITSNNEEILAQEYRIRLRGIDAPEMNMEFGQEAKDALRKLIQGKPLTIHVYDKDPFDRLVGDVYCNGIFVQDFLRSYSHPFPQIQTQVSGPSSRPEGVQFELHTLPVDEKLVGDGDGMTVHVNTEDPRESGIVPIEVHEATIGRRQAHAIRDYALADALHNIIINCGYRVISYNNEEILAREYRIRLRGIDAPEMNMELGQEAKDALRKLIQRKPLTIHVYDKDSYDTLVGDVYCNGIFVQGFLRFYTLQLPQIQTQVSGPSSWPKGVQFELHTLPVNEKLVGDGDGMTVHVNTEDPRESGIIPKEVYEATIVRRQARAIRDCARANALHNSIIKSRYRVITSNNEEILAQEYRIRLRGIDAPEMNMEFGQEAKDALRKLIQGKPLTIHVYDKDRYDRLVGDVYCNGIFVQEELLRKGCAWHYEVFDKRPALAQWEKEARNAGRGLWANPNPIEPWEFKKKERNRKNGQRP